MDNIKKCFTTTIVSAFLGSVNNREDRNISEYFHLGKLLLKCNVPKILFLDEEMIHFIVHYFGNSILNNENTKIYKINKTDMYFYRFDKYLSKFNLHTDNLNKDTKEYIFTMCHKTEWMKQAIIANDFNTDNFIWVDFGIRHVFNGSDDEFIREVYLLQYKEYSNIRIASIWNGFDQSLIYTKIMWFFAGGVFGGNKSSLLLFAEKMKEKCIEIMITKQTLPWEVNVWCFIYQENPELFDRYLCNHNKTILMNY